MTRKPLSAEGRKRQNAHNRAYTARMSPEQRARRDEIKRLWVKNNPEKIAVKNAKHAQWKRDNAERLREYQRVYTKKWRLTHRRTLETPPRLIFSDATYAAIQRHVARYYQPADRDDIISIVTVAVFEGAASLDDIPSAVRTARSSHYAERARWLSLDAPIPGMEGLTYVDRLASDVEHF